MAIDKRSAAFKPYRQDRAGRRGAGNAVFRRTEVLRPPGQVGLSPASVVARDPVIREAYVPAAWRSTEAWYAGSDDVRSRETGPSVIQELDCVVLRAQLSTADGMLMPGTCGTVVFRYAAGDAFEVEFLTPFHALVTLRSEEIEPARG